jgi:hypothetical protein
MATTPLVTKSRDNSGVQGGSTARDELINYNKLVANYASLLDAQTATGNVTVVTPTIGTTVTIAVPASVIQIAGVRTLVAALTAQALGALGTIPASTWGLITMERVAAGTATFVSAAANYTTGYASEALAKAALPAISANKVRVGYATILASASTWVAGTDALAGGTGGNPATTTHYFAGDTSIYDSSLLTAEQIGNMNGTVITA